MKKKIVLFETAVVLVLTIVLNIAAFFNYQQFFQKQLTASYETMANQNFQSVNFKIQQYITLINSVSQNGKIHDVLTDSKSNPVDKGIIINKEILNLMEVSGLGENCQLTIYPENDDYWCSSAFVRSKNEMQDSAKKLSEKRHNNTVLFGENYYMKYLTITRLIQQNNVLFSSDSIATISLEANLKSIFSYPENVCDIYVYDADGFCVYTSSDSDKFQMEKFNISSNNKVFDDEKKLVFSRGFLGDQLRVTYAFSMADSIKQFQKNLYSTMFCSLIMLMLVFIIIFKYAGTLTEKIDFILEKVSKVEKGEWKSDKTLKGQDEFAMIDDSVNKVILKIDQLVQERYMAEISSKNAQLDALQMQINPHFLYNTLDLINRIAIVKKCPEISTISQKLGEMFRYNISLEQNCKTAPLEKEIAHVLNYIDIQNIRFCNRIEVYLDIQEEVKKCIVLKFILQPIVENAIKHGFDNSYKSGSISIEARIVKEGLCIVVHDDGKGISEECLEKLEKEINEDGETEHVGIKNIHKRLKMTYGEQYGISIMSRENIGTRVILRMPAQYEGEG